jgi:hypothetical protein
LASANPVQSNRAAKSASRAERGQVAGDEARRNGLFAAQKTKTPFAMPSQPPTPGVFQKTHDDPIGLSIDRLLRESINPQSPGI